MSSQSNGHKSDGDSTPTSGIGRRLVERAPSAWGAARDALAAVNNLEALLRSTSVTHPTLLDLLPELRASAAVLSDVFDVAREGDAAASAVGAYGQLRVAEFGRVLDATATGMADRDGLALQLHTVGEDLETSADLLALLERSAAPLATEVSLNVIVRETARMLGTGRGRELVVRFDEASPDCVVATDPYTIGALLAIAVARVHGAGVGGLVVRTRSSSSHAVLVVEAAGPADLALAGSAMRVLPAVPPTDQAAQRVADRVGAILVIEPARWTIALAVDAVAG